MAVTKNFKQMLKAGDIDKIIDWFKQTYLNKYYDAYCSQFEFPELNYQAKTWLLAHLWSDGSVWVRKNDVTGDPVFCKYAGTFPNHYNFPTKAQLINTFGAPNSEIPSALQDVDKDGTIIYLRPNGKGLCDDVMYYIGKIAEAEAAISINLELQKMPWILAGDDISQEKIRQLVNRIFSNEIAVFADFNQDSIEAFQLNAPYIIDKLTAYETELENKLKTILGLDNQGGFLNKQQQNLDITNSNNDEINKAGEAMYETIKDGFDRANKILGLNLVVISKLEKSVQEGTSHGLGEDHDYPEKGGEE